ncbi:GerMN domain-containing protein [Kribbella sp. NPDC048915]|uniref:GerMN domain-containing protein n=1 Tax=Kribbella sp. NPDC048915 TaxID=3155148 RepID=UPI0033F28734
MNRRPLRDAWSMATIVLVAVAALLVGCGVPVQNEPSPIDPAAVPTRLHSPTSPRSAPPAATPGRATIQVVFVQKEQLVTLVRDASDPDPSDRLQTVIAALLAGPTAAEQANGLTSALPPDLQLSVGAIEGTRLELELSGETGGRSAAENVLAVGQIVLSVTAVPGIDEVTFSRDGKPVEALLADGALTGAPLKATDFAALRAR